MDKMSGLLIKASTWIHLKIIMLKEGSRHRRATIVMIPFIWYLRKCETTLTWIRPVVTQGWHCLQRDMGTSGVAGDVRYLDCSSSYITICIFVKKYETLHLKWVKCVLYKLYLKKPDLIPSLGKPWIDSPVLNLEISECCPIGSVCFKSQNRKES